MPLVWELGGNSENGTTASQPNVRMSLPQPYNLNLPPNGAFDTQDWLHRSHPVGSVPEESWNYILVVRSISIPIDRCGGLSSGEFSAVPRYSSGYFS